MPVSERGYGQFINTSLIGGTAPDIIERGFSDVATSPSYVARFFTPLRSYILDPNRYNRGTALESARCGYLGAARGTPLHHVEDQLLAGAGPCGRAGG